MLASELYVAVTHKHTWVLVLSLFVYGCWILLACNMFVIERCALSSHLEACAAATLLLATARPLKGRGHEVHACICMRELACF